MILLKQWGPDPNTEFDDETGKPTRNAFVESFNVRFRDGCLNRHRFPNLADARRIINDWQRRYNDIRPHSSLAF